MTLSQDNGTDERFNADVCTSEATLQQAPKILQTIGVNIVTHVLLHVVNGLMDMICIQAIVGSKSISEHMGSSGNILANFCLNRHPFSIRNMIDFDLPTKLQDSHDNIREIALLTLPV